MSSVSKREGATEGYTKLDSDDEGSSLTSTVINTVKSVLGAGVLTLSWAFYFSSLWPGIVGTCAMCVMSSYGFYLIGVCSAHTGKGSFGDMWSALFGETWAWIPDLVSVLFCTIAIVANLIVVGGYLPTGLAGFGLPQIDRAYCILGASLFILPLNFVEDLSKLSFASFVGNFSVVYTTGLLLFKWLTIDHDADWVPWEVEPGFFLTMATLAFSFNGHFGAPALYQQLKGKSPQRWMTVTVFAFGICLPILLICSFTGYLMFGSTLLLPGESNVLLAPSMKGPEVMAAFIGMTLTNLFSVPIYTSCVRVAIDGMWMRAMKASESLFRKRVISALCVLGTIATALSVTSLGLTVAINGAVCASLMEYVLPALMCLKTNPKSKAMPVVTLILGVIIGVAGIITSVMQALGMSGELMPP